RRVNSDTLFLIDFRYLSPASTVSLRSTFVVGDFLLSVLLPGAFPIAIGTGLLLFSPSDKGARNRTVDPMFLGEARPPPDTR
ncbi:MAG: hypothetical protein KAX05_07585, partial [Bacteroidales bacterium]|nr:hypothetical protein [Bacteroidales bacterium]